MSSQICVNCSNKKPVNQTDNRLVTESCGHVKCMDCLLHEKSGCVACMQNGSDKEILERQQEKDTPVKTYTLSTEFEELTKEEQDLCMQKKLEITHIKIRLDGGKKCYKCTACEKTFTARSQVSYHAYCNGQKKPYYCQSCKQSFASQSHYKYHLRTHNQDRAFTCEECGSSFYAMSKLKRHSLKHTKEKKYSCNDCTKAFNNLTSLRKHTLTHTQERPYACAACGRRFRDSSNYKKHVDKHKKLCESCGEELVAGAEASHVCVPGGTGPKPHGCPRCRKSFHSRKDMRRHAATHSDSKPFRCKVCPEERRFRRKDNLERHIRNAHPECSTASALDCDLMTLDILADQTMDANDSQVYEKKEKIRLETLNPLPPLPQEVIEKHIDVGSQATQTPKSPVDKKSILEANNARESVIVEKRNPDCEKKVSSPENEYVHKIRKAIVPLPPIDQEKFRSIQRGHLPDNVTTAPITNMEIYKKILFEKIEKDTAEVIQSPKMHWRRKMEQDIN